MDPVVWRRPRPVSGLAAVALAVVAGLLLGLGIDVVRSGGPAGWLARHPLLGPLRPEYEAFADGLRDTVSRVDSLDWPASEAQLRASSVAGIPIEVLRAPRAEPRLTETQNAEIAAAWQAAFEWLSPGFIRWTTAWGAGHNVQIDRPDLVDEAARRLVDLDRDG